MKLKDSIKKIDDKFMSIEGLTEADAKSTYGGGDITLKYGVPPTIKYGVPPTLKYGVPPTVKYGVPPIMKYGLPSTGELNPMYGVPTPYPYDIEK